MRLAVVLLKNAEEQLVPEVRVELTSHLDIKEAEKNYRIPGWNVIDVVVSKEEFSPKLSLGELLANSKHRSKFQSFLQQVCERHDLPLLKEMRARHQHYVESLFPKPSISLPKESSPSVPSRKRRP